MHRGFYAVRSHNLKILSRNKILTSIKGYNFVTNKQNMEDSNPNIYLIKIYTFTKVKFYPFVLKILRRNNILLTIKGHNFVTNLLKITGKNATDTILVNLNAFIKGLLHGMGN